ncbi:Z1 domain-containing protein [Pontixanthobacter aquaemixtae]|uniref:Putative endonuclease Z1 domain-containing protein n=1 Tax=Pontixanthobacter aquaemixtae TaxID=1958940 RepID=A0A844ZUU0_9SPHN|nr:Z1 domain-containing protein [Pontixanthobacter aquaemixtae]MXO91508.1 hypothetical protein [Pontixanthobacter aquaemixtae]
MSIKAKAGYFALLVRERYADELKQMASIPPEAIDTVLQEDPFALSEENLAAVRRHLEFQFSVRQDAGHSVKSDYKPWLRERTIDFYYWDRLRKYYLESDALPPNVISRLDEVTDEVLDYCGNPEDEGTWGRRGMVMGHVQSGKTTNYASLICKAADAGYKIIILLAGLTNSLRTQTQERMDETFIGKKSLFGQRFPDLMPIMSHCPPGERFFPVFGTTRDSDFNTEISKFGVTLDNLKDPIIFVTKKNKGILENLLKWIEGQRQDGRKIDYPLLMIDDEADNASINTHKDPTKSTAINNVMRLLLQQFNRSSYVGYTATPFANIFIDPESEAQMRGDDLFPRHFIKALDPPTNYVGATKVFSPEGSLRPQMLRVVEDYGDILPLKHKKDLELEELPPSLLEAIRAFVLIRAMRVLRGDGEKHCSMMINVSRFNDVQARIHDLVYSYQQRLDDAIKVNSGLGSAAIQDPDILELKQTFEREFQHTEFDFDEVLPALTEASKTIKVRTINMRGGALNYEESKEHGLHVIAIGGLALSRGLTLEGLSVSYLLRNSAASDTLMQMARWFGYRRNYEDLCRLYICQSAVDHYEYIDDAVEELRGELKRMEARGETPEQFGLKVRRSETGIMITAANKMRSAQRMQLAESFAYKHVEGFALFNDAKVNRTNLEGTCAFLEELGRAERPAGSDDEQVRKELEKHLAWRGVDGRKIHDLLMAFQFHANQPSLGKIDGTNSLLSDYISDRLQGELSTWDVVVPFRFPKGGETKPQSVAMDKIDQYGKWPLRSRNSGKVKSINGIEAFKPFGDRNRIADPSEDPPLLLTEEQRGNARKRRKDGFRGDTAFCAARKKPLLIVHLFDVADPSEELKRSFKIKDLPVVSLSFCIPKTHSPVQPKEYEVNAVYRQQLELLAQEPDDDEEIFDG